MPLIGFCSRGLKRLSHLDVLLEAQSYWFALRPVQSTTHIAGWGRKPSATRAREIAVEAGLPFVSLEDGFLRSFGLGVQGALLHSLIVDYTGIYYDATAPSDLENLIRAADFSSEELTRARAGIALLQRLRLSKFNCASDTPVVWPDGRRRVLVVDQTFGDAAITYGGADASSFTQMLETAIADNPDAEVVVKVHPDVIAGKKRGYLLDAAREHDCRVWSEDISPWALLDAVDKVYVVTSQFGFDALLAGKPVCCFGMPFFAGWGLTEDLQTCARRGQHRSLEQVFAAAYLRYCRYINPYTGKRCTFEDTARLISEQVKRSQHLAGSWLGVDFSPWKRGFVADFLARPKQCRFVRRHSNAFSEVEAETQVVAWASSLTEPVVTKCSNSRLPLWRLEDGFLRSVGLGSDLVRPLSLVLDKQGIYYDASRPSDLESILKDAELSPLLCARAAALRETLVTRQLSKYNVGEQGVALDLPSDRTIILVPGQVESDASIASGSPWLKSNQQLLEQVRRANPDAYIIYKPHPDVVAGGRIGKLADDAGVLYDQLVADAPMPAVLARVDELHTLCSLSGFEALLRGVKVVTYGLPFYAGWGLSDDRLLGEGCDEMPNALSELAMVRRCKRARGRSRTLDELVAATLILYPTYVDPHRGDIVDVETAVQLLASQQQGSSYLSWWRRGLYRIVRNQFFKK
ncbi:beta-3-deoxy-D-manno-oct-2-ulosonic acid transferase [Microbulbifer agarilyticus]|uniref:Beta-3-deoxy-D-manno-oct-2-ulosonic acid transferase n=1 Tax=Microbulbifer agarilyticus TaxID=260552 RepID=A0A1Q2M325_9GAMM|nr:beta-3-deoxy-D-manno-oct-2-ulosonic acid transferase [Microbulbifer agarilyticus]